MKFTHSEYEEGKKEILNPQTGRFFRISFWMLVVTIFGGILGYLYQIQVARLLNLSDFAIFSALMGLGVFIGSPLATLLMLVARRVAILKANDNYIELRLMFWRLNKIVLFTGILLFLIFIFWVNSLQHYLKVTSFFPILLFYVYILFAGLHQIGLGFLQGGQFYVWFSTLFLLGFLLKILLSWIFIDIGLGLNGAMLAISMTIIIIWAIGFWAALNKFSKEKKYSTCLSHKIRIKEVFPILAANIMFAAMTQLDVLLVNWYFSPEITGKYAAASVMGKAALFIPSSLVIALYPMVATNHSKKIQSTHLLTFSLVTSFALSGTIASIYWYFSDQIIYAFFGERYDGAESILKWYGLAIMPMSLIVVAEHFLMAKGKYFFTWLFLLVAPIQVYAINKWHDELLNVLTIIGICGVFMLFVGIIYITINDELRN